MRCHDETAKPLRDGLVSYGVAGNVLGFTGSIPAGATTTLRVGTGLPCY
jgi:hypothetical protein